VIGLVKNAKNIIGQEDHFAEAVERKNQSHFAVDQLDRIKRMEVFSSTLAVLL
jgi:hypothetical protein